jgi:hypothetical protein
MTPRRASRTLQVLVALALALSGCFQSTRHVSGPDGTVMIEKGKCSELTNLAADQTCTDHKRVRVGATVLLSVGVVLVTLVVLVFSHGLVVSPA